MLEIEKYKFAFEISPMPLMLVSGGGNIELTNRHFERLFDYDEDELLGKNVDILVPDAARDYHPILRDAYTRVPTKRTMGANRDLRGVTKSGRTIPLELGLEPMKNGKETWALVVAIDLSARQQMENRMRQALDASASAMIMVDQDSRIIFINETALVLLGYEKNNIMGQNIEMLVPDEVKRAHPVYVGSFMHNRKTRTMGLGSDLYARHHDGSKIPVEIALTPVISGTDEFVMCTVSDLTERVAASDALAEKNTELADLNVDLSQFAYSASHDLKAPLSTIVGLMNVCIEDLDDNNLDEVRENFARIMDIAKRSTEKVESVLEIARAAGKKITAEPVNIETEINNIWMDLAGAENHIQLKLVLTHKDPIMLERATFGVILENLISNAVRYSDKDKKSSYIKVNSHLDDKGLQIVVSDNGIGIPEENLEHVFQMFRRLDERSGDGLGLALVKKQLDRLGGSIAVNSTVGKGTEFTITMPVQEDEAQ